MAISHWLTLIYKFSIFLRLLLTVWPLTAFTIQDDIELLSDFLSASVLKFSSPTTTLLNSKKLSNSTSLLFPLITGGLPSIFLKILQQNGLPNIISLRTIVVAPRLLCVMASLIIDNLLYKIARKWRIKPNLTMAFYCASFIPWVYFSRCSSYLFDTLLLVAIFYIVVFSFEDQDDHHHDCFSVHDVSYTTTRASIYLGILVSLGVFHRLKFAVFILAPLLQFLVHDFSTVLTFRKLVSLSFGFTCCSLILSLIDSLYYGTLNFSDLVTNQNIDAAVFQKNLTIVPLNTLREVLSFSHLEGKTVHPWYTHAFVNVPFMYGILGLAVLYYVLQCFSPSILSNFHNINFKYWMFLSSFCVPLICLSIYPVKETIQLCPLIIPLVLLCVVRFCQYSDRMLTYIYFSWFFWNFFSLLYHGILRNGAVLDSLSYVQKYELLALNESYSMPVSYHFLSTDLPPDSWYMTSSQRLYSVYHYDKKSYERSLGDTLKNFNNSLLAYVFVPATLNLCKLHLPKNVKLKLLETFPYHISPESPLKAKHFFCSTGSRKRSCAEPCDDGLFEFLYNMLSLRLFLVTMV